MTHESVSVSSIIGLRAWLESDGLERLDTGFRSVLLILGEPSVLGQPHFIFTKQPDLSQINPYSLNFMHSESARSARSWDNNACMDRLV